MVGRDPGNEFRAATPLELFFDLVFVVAVSLAADRLDYALAEGRVTGSLLSYGLVFFGIWWAWVNFTWFASAYDTDDVVYRLFVFVTITGALVLARGRPAPFYPALDRVRAWLAGAGFAIREELEGPWVGGE
jgi:low temperature requirement protein LtrA